jgi:heavy metal sensor kinase
MRKTMAEPTRFWRTLRFRFALMTAGLLLLALVGFGAFVYGNMASSLSASVNEALRLNAAQGLTAVEVEDGQLDLPDSFVQGPDTANIRRQNFVLRILDPDGRVLRAYGAYPDLPVTAESAAAAQRGEASFATVTDPTTGDAVRLYTVSIVTRGQTVGMYQVGQSLAGVENTLRELLRALLIGGPALVLAAGLGGYLLAARALAPIDRITRTARRISAEDLSARLDAPPADDEVGRLAATLNGMLARLEAAFAREQRFAADASHELRTPLAAMQAILDVTRERRRRPAEYERALDDLAEETNRLSKLTRSLLLLAREDGGDALAREPVDLSTLLRDIADSMRPLAAEKGLELACDVPDGLTVTGDPDGLIRAFVNLLDNAIKYTERGRVALSARRAGSDGVEVTVRDTGIGIPPEHLPHIFERFYRIERSRTSEGVGLGLAIARRIVRAHDGVIEVESAPGAGTTFTVRLP